MERSGIFKSDPSSNPVEGGTSAVITKNLSLLVYSLGALLIPISEDY